VPKMKTRKAMKARFKITATGKLLRTRPGKRHILTKKSAKRKKNLGKARLVDDGQVKMYRDLIGSGA
jgi:large subunit ribosomal protein L35